MAMPTWPSEREATLPDPAVQASVLALLARSLGSTFAQELQAEKDRQGNPTRLVRCGPLIRGTRKSNDKVYWFFLFTTRFFYCTRSKVIPKRLTVNRVLPLATLSVSNRKESLKEPNALEVFTESKSFLIFARTPSEKKDWAIGTSTKQNNNKLKEK